ncbi:unnamed protein product [Bursaphelenchus okinawaensis]|uniref:F-box domain-containing protein n=1 Tax=Bursaphelenchus okinawaensis TaxID=465554 RepID=A0A811K6Q8_9BILA|nr:unnamed protein product [Bursaphelenchus okinawaensis]CAG9092577.1 unnamed protein product [Bursaphelenchus okinawaensis]
MDLIFMETRMLREISSNYVSPERRVKGFRRRNSQPYLPDPFEKYNVGDGVISMIFDYVSVRDLTNLMVVSKRFNRVASQSSHWEKLSMRRTNIDIDAFHNILSRNVKQIELKQPSTIFTEHKSNVWMDTPLTVQPQIMLDRLVYLDLANVVFSDSNCLLSILKRTRNLEALNISSYPYLDTEHCDAISNNQNLLILNIQQCRGLTHDGIAKLCRCVNLIELNAAWTILPSGGTALLCKMIPDGVLRFSIAGRSPNELVDPLIQLLLKRCVVLRELDISDCPNVTEAIIEYVNEHEELLVLSAARCYAIEPEKLMRFTRLQVLNIYGCVTDDGVKFLQRNMKHTKVNRCPFIDIAQPTMKSLNA